MNWDFTVRPALSQALYVHFNFIVLTTTFADEAAETWT